jgi:4-hydroxyphenylpyruvate dioxygenase
MEIDHIHFYVDNAVSTRDWFIEKMGFQHLSQGKNHHTQTEVVGNNSSIFLVISSPLDAASPVSHYLNSHPSGVVDVAFRVQNLDSLLTQSSGKGIKVINPPQTYLLKQKYVKLAKIKGWGYLNHTLIEHTTTTPFCALLPELTLATDIDFSPIGNCSPNTCDSIIDIDHVVLNVPSGELVEAVRFYQTIFGFQLQQRFNIKTTRSGLYSEALISPNRKVQFNINEPTSDNSQIQEFLDANGGSGIQHIALKSTNILQTVAQMRQRGLSFLAVPKAYYSQLRRGGRNGLISLLQAKEWRALENERILVDCHQNRPESLLMQIFTKPIFAEPTFFVELIERRKQAEGFGEGNFQALFEAIEREQVETWNFS